MATALPKEELRALFSKLSGLPLTRVLWSGEPRGFAGPTDEGKTGHLVLDCTRTRGVGVDDTCEALNAASLSLNADEDGVSIKATAGNRVVPFASMNVTLNQLVTLVKYTDDPYIDEVEVSGEDALAVAGTFTVEP